MAWAIKEFSLEGVLVGQFRMRGRDMCAMGKENFLARTPPFMGDILWEHLEILQKGTAKYYQLPFYARYFFSRVTLAKCPPVYYLLKLLAARTLRFC